MENAKRLEIADALKKSQTKVQRKAVRERYGLTKKELKNIQNEYLQCDCRRKQDIQAAPSSKEAVQEERKKESHTEDSKKKGGWHLDFQLFSLKFNTGESERKMPICIKVGVTLVLLGVANVLFSGSMSTSRQ